MVSHTVPLVGPHGEGALLFNRWLPDGAEHALTVTSSGIDCRLWLDRSCVRSFHDVTDDLIAQWVNISVVQVFVDASPEPASAELADFIRDNEKWPKGNDILASEYATTRRLALEYQELGRRVLRCVLFAVNRLVAWAYAEKHQYWLHAHDEQTQRMMSLNNEFRARVSVDGGPWLRWCPPSVDSITIQMLDEGSFIQAVDWVEVRDFLQTGRRPNLVAQLLSQAATLLRAGHYRAALIEAVSALELALRTFARRPDPVALRVLPGGLPDVERSLQADVDHLGFSRSLRYLLPLIMNSDSLPADAHILSCKAVTVRQNVVHNGQREIDRDEAQAFVRAIATLAAALQDASLDDGARAHR